MKLKSLIAKAKVLDIQDADVEDIIVFINDHENPLKGIDKCGYCERCNDCAIRVLECKTINSLPCPIFKYKHDDSEY